MNVIITGVTSFIGCELSKLFIEHGDTVYGICRETSTRINNLPLGIKSVIADLTSLHQIEIAVRRADIFINLAWEGTGHSGRDLKEIQEDNVKHTLEAMLIAKRLGCKLFVESGSQAEYGTCTDLITETTPCNPFSEYGKAKLQVWEKGSVLCHSLGLKYLHLRIFSTFGENDHPWTLIMSCISKMLKNEVVELSSCQQYWNFIYVKDEVELIVRLCQYAINNSDFGQEIFNVASASSKPLKQYVLRIKELIGSSSELKFGAISPTNIVSLNADITKSYTATKFKERYSFDQVIHKIIAQKKQK